MEKKEEYNEIRMKRFEDFKKQAISSRAYAIQRFDLLIIAISTTGIIIVLNILKTYIELDQVMAAADRVVLKLSAGFFAVSIALNFISQLSSHKAFLNEEFWAHEVLKRMDNDDEYCVEKEQKYRETFINNHKITKYMNRVSTLTLFTAFLLIGYFFTFSL